MTASHADDVEKHTKTYVNVFLTLLVLTVVTVGISYVHLAVPLAITVALIVALVKGSLVASFFMHLAGEQKAIFAALLLTAIFFAALLLLPVLTYMGGIGTPQHTEVVSGAESGH
jgi:cytochrome c oxidase subunit 4